MADTVDNSSTKVDSADESSADKIFDQFCDSNNFQEILQLLSSLCAQVRVDPDQYEGFYSSLKISLKTWKAVSLFQLLDARASLPVYEGQKACTGKRVLIVGAGPVGLRAAIEMVLLGAKVDVVEKRSDFSRNNSLHLWPFVMADLRNLGVKKFYGKFASGSIDHFSIKILQAVLLKICLLLGVKVHPRVTFNSLLEPKDTNSGWRVLTTPTNTPISSFDFDVILAADGKQNSLPGFHSKEFRAKLALAITVNYVNHNTKQENSVPEIGGLSYVYRQDFFNNLAKVHGIELENIVYYKDETHYFVMTVKKSCLLKKGVLKKDNSDTKHLLSKDNIDRGNLEAFSLEATSLSTDNALGEVEFEKNHRGENDVALFDFTSLFASQNAARIIERKGKKLLLCLAGDSLIEPFWPTGSGCARGFLGAFDNAWMIKRFSTESVSPMELIEEREAILYLLPQTTSIRLQSNYAGYTIDPKTRYMYLSELVPPGDVTHLYDSDNQNAINAVRSRSTVAPLTQPKSPPASEQKAAVITNKQNPKRSKSTENLSLEAPSAENPTLHFTPLKGMEAKPFRQPDTASSESPATSAKEVKHFWQKKGSSQSTPQPPNTSVEKAKAKTAPQIEGKTGKNITPLKPPPSPSSSTKVKGKVYEFPEFKNQPLKKHDTPTEGGQVHSSSVVSKGLLTEEHSLGKVKPKNGDKAKIGVATKQANKRTSSPKPHRSNKQTSSPKPDQSNKRTSSPKPDQSNKRTSSSKPDQSNKRTSSPKPDRSNKQTSSPKLARFSLPSKTRSRSESPERAPTLRNKGMVSKDTQAAQPHPLSVAKSLQSLDRESEGVTEGEAQANVSDIVKKYHDRAESLAPTQTSASKEKQPHDSRGMVKKSPKPDSKKEGTAKTASNKEKKAKTKDNVKAKEAVSRGKSGFFSFFKSRKSYSVSTASKDSSAADVKKATKEDQIQSRVDENRELSVQRRIGRLKEQGLVTDEVDGPHVVLLGVSSLEMPQTETGECRVEEDSSVRDEPSPEEPPTSLVSETAAVVLASKVEEHTQTVEAENEETEVETNAERVKRLREMFVTKSVPRTTRHLSYTQKRSKEIDFSELMGRKSRSESSHPLWLARVIQGLNKCLERLRKENDIMVVKTALEILSTIISNVQSNPDSDVYRRVRVASEKFRDKVWQYNDASQFLARSGWVEIDEFIVLPMDANVDNPKRVLDKHLDIVNQMLWSLRLDRLGSPGVIKRLKIESKLKMRSASLLKRESYASRIVDDSLQRIEEHRLNMITAKLRESSVTSLDPSVHAEVQSSEVNSESCLAEGSAVEELNATSQSMSPREGKELEESQTIRAASAARNVWLKRALEQETRATEKNYKAILETELYDLPGSKQLSPPLADVPEGNELPVEEDNLCRDPQQDCASGTKDTQAKQSFVVTDEHLRKLTSSTKQSPLKYHPPQSSHEKVVESASEFPVSEESEREVNRETVPSESESKNVALVGETSLSQEMSDSQGPVSSSPSSSFGQRSGDQLRLLIMDTQQADLPKSCEEDSGKSEDERIKHVADTQHSSVHAVKSERLEYGMMVTEAASQTRQKWINTEAAAGNQGDKQKPLTTQLANMDLVADSSKGSEQGTDTHQESSTL